MSTALIGYTGFVGSTLRQQTTFDALYHSANVETLQGQSYDLVVVAAAPAAKWIANANPAQDLTNINRLTSALKTMNARQVVLVSTIDAYPTPIGVDEHTPIDRAAGAAYGRHRLALEDFVCDHFPTSVVRLPALFGAGLRKNALHDLVHDHEVHKVDSRGIHQFYDMSRASGATSASCAPPTSPSSTSATEPT